MINIELKDNLEFMKTIDSNLIDCIYSDILYGTGRDFIQYKDLKAIRSDIEEHYIPRIKEMYRILKDTGSIYLQMDMKINHWLRIIMDDIFGYNNFRSELIWCYSVQGYSKDNYSAKHDTILYYCKSNKFTFNLESIREKLPSETTIDRFLKTSLKNKGYYNGKTKKWVDIENEEDFYLKHKGHPPYSWFNLGVLTASDKERSCGDYPTQKPKELIKRFLLASTNENDLVADFYLGSGTTAVVCKELNRSFIGCDINPYSIELTNKRLNEIKNYNENIFEF